MNKNIINNLAKWFNRVGRNFIVECALAESKEEARDLYAISKDCLMIAYGLGEMASNLCQAE